jgi:predicted secreted Zn-dependent protease
MSFPSVRSWPAPVSWRVPALALALFVATLVVFERPRPAGRALPSPAPTLAEPAGPGLAARLAGAPNVRIRYYAVTGADAAAIRRSMAAQGLRDLHDGRPVDALTRWRVHWRWPDDGAGGCDLARAVVGYEAEVLLPRHADENALAPALRQRWRAYVAALEAHEAGHVRYPYAHLSEVRDALRRSDCAGANAAAERAVARIGSHDAAYDAASRHGASEGAVFP